MTTVKKETDAVTVTFPAVNRKHADSKADWWTQQYRLKLKYRNTTGEAFDMRFVYAVSLEPIADA